MTGLWFPALRERLARRRAKRARGAELEVGRRERKHVVQRGTIGFTYRPTPPSGPAPGAENSQDQPQS